MEKNNTNNNDDSKINNLFIELMNDLKEIINKYKDDFIIKKIGEVINKINFIIKDKNEQTRNLMQQMFSQQNKILEVNKKLNEQIINNNNYINEFSPLFLLL